VQDGAASIVRATLRHDLPIMSTLTPGASARDDLPRAVLYMLLVAILIPLLNASAKYLAARYPILEITWARYAGHFFYMMLVFAPRRGLSLLAAQRAAPTRSPSRIGDSAVTMNGPVKLTAVAVVSGT